MMKTPRVLIVEDQHALALALAAAVRQSGASSEIAPTAAIARELLNSKLAEFSAMILDIGLPDENGLDLLASLPAACRVPTIVITAHGEIDNTIAARKLGVADFLTKPLDFPVFAKAVRRILPDQEPEKAPHHPDRRSSPFIGASPAMRPVFQQIAHACATEEPVLISGETGTGKSLAASVIRRSSSQAEAPFAAFQQGAGDQAAEFAMAINQASGGILLLEGIENLNPNAQGELVRRWEDGSDREFPRIIATSGPELREAVRKGTLRSDLYYRLQVLEVRLPPLRERIEDLPALFDFFLAEIAPDRTIQAEGQTLKQLQRYPWPGNLRELRNIASFSITASGGANRIAAADLPDHLGSQLGSAEDDPAENLDTALGGWIAAKLGIPEEESPLTYREIAGDLERRLIRQLLNRHDGKLARLATEMKANRTTLRKKLRDP